MSPLRPSETPDQEWFDVVDERDQVIDRMQRSEVHRLKLLHRAVHVFLFRPDGRLLIHQRSPTKEEFPGVWTSSCSGHVSAGESYDDSAVRELQEELGVSAPLERLRKFDACRDTSFEFTTLYRAVSSDEIFPDNSEMAAVRWQTVIGVADELQRHAESFSPAFRLLFAWFLNNLHGR